MQNIPDPGSEFKHNSRILLDNSLNLNTFAEYTKYGAAEYTKYGAAEYTKNSTTGFCLPRGTSIAMSCLSFRYVEINLFNSSTNLNTVVVGFSVAGFVWPKLANNLFAQSIACD